MLHENPKTAEEAVANGVELLDKEFGKSWRRDIRPDELYMSDYCGCVLAHISGATYTDGLRDIGLHPWTAYLYGFEIPEADDPWHWSYSELDELWKEEVGGANN